MGLLLLFFFVNQKDEECSVWCSDEKFSPLGSDEDLRCYALHKNCARCEKTWPGWTELRISRDCALRAVTGAKNGVEKKKEEGGGDVTVRWCKGLEINRLLISRPFCVRLCFRSHAIISRPFCHYAATISSSFRDDFACDSGLYFTSSDDNTSQLGSNEDLRCWALHESRANLTIFSDTPHSCINKEHIHAKGYKISSANETFLEITWLNWPGDLIRRWSQRTQQRIAPTSDYLSKSIMTHTALKKQQRKRRRYLIHGSWLRRPVLIKDHHQYPRCFSHSTHIRCCSNRMLKRNVHAIRFVSSQNACWVYPQSACVKWCFIVLRGLLGTVRNI